MNKHLLKTLASLLVPRRQQDEQALAQVQNIDSMQFDEIVAGLKIFMIITNTHNQISIGDILLLNERSLINGMHYITGRYVTILVDYVCNLRPDFEAIVVRFTVQKVVWKDEFGDE